LVSVKDVPSQILIRRLAEHLKTRVPQVEPPAWAAYVRTGSHVERPPQDRDWWYVRCASLLRKIYLHGPLGLDDLRAAYGGRKKTGFAMFHHRKAGGSIIRKALQQLQRAELVEVVQGRGRRISPKGAKLLDSLSTEILKELARETPGLARYR
jgi:small subunit ribosomal protein S19e